MADAEGEPRSAGGILLALILGISASATLVAALSVADAPYGVAAWMFICYSLGALVSPRLPPAGFVMGLGGGFCALVALAFTEPGLMFFHPDCGSGCEAARAAADARLAPFESIVFVSAVVQLVLGVPWMIIAVGHAILHRKPLEPLADHNQAQRSLPRARVLRDRRVE
jgi:hypothetical protein